MVRGENISLSFRTRQSPALLLYISSFYKGHLALLIHKHVADTQSVTRASCVITTMYREPEPEPCVGSFLMKSLGSRDSGELDPELARLALLGFTGCLSAVQFNSISPLKAALIHPDTSPVTISGPLVQSKCGSSAPTNADAENIHHQSGPRGPQTPAADAPLKCFVTVEVVQVFSRQGVSLTLTEHQAMPTMLFWDAWANMSDQCDGTIVNRPPE
ncbi:hypothetical protein NHX12_003645 [Muraenolepis orangiensis]|uniref:Uncharacterized protein n=1 Tax=Muraenolepis orangiensis TaxID=630683 RepID=A0A9Q0DTY6_9TELE|nr:hypothetical protein NHX12_003645 [Muraenolepis orangiensis]